MRLSSTSSSLFLATLAVSASSTALAAPAEPHAHEPAIIPSSSSNSQSIAMAARSDLVDIDQAQIPSSESHPVLAHVPGALDRRGLLDLLGGLPVVGPVIGPLVGKLLGLLGLSGIPLLAADSIQSLSPDQIRILAEAIADAHAQMQSVSRSLAVDGIPQTRGRIVEWDAVADPPPSNATTSSSVAASSSSPSAADPATTSTPQGSQTAPTTPSNSTSSANGPRPPTPAPPVPPPNTPASLPISPPLRRAKSPSAILSRMFPMMRIGIKAADGQVEVSVGNSGPDNSTSTATATDGEATPSASGDPAANSTSTVFDNSTSTVFANSTTATLSANSTSTASNAIFARARRA